MQMLELYAVADLFPTEENVFHSPPLSLQTNLLRTPTFTSFYLLNIFHSYYLFTKPFLAAS